VSAGLTDSDGSVAGAVTNDDSSDAVTGLRGSAAPLCASITPQHEHVAYVLQIVRVARLSEAQTHRPGYMARWRKTRMTGTWVRYATQHILRIIMQFSFEGRF
jgi:hypothetical protein